MARSAFVEVNITNPTRLAQDSQDTANNAVKGVTNLNDPNLMNVIEKQNNIVQFAGLTSQFNVLVQNAKDEGIDTTAVTTAYNNLNKFMTDILADPNHASDIDRARYKKYQDAYNEELAKLQNALQNNTNDKFASAASALSQAASTANIAKSAADSTYAYANSEMAVQSTATAKAQSAANGAFSQAQVVGSQAGSAIAVQSTATAKAQSAADNAFNKAQSIGNQASSEIAVQSNATAKAQSTADSAFSQATTAIDNGKVTSQAVTDLKDGSKLTIAELENGLATKVANSDYASYKEQTASQIGQLVTNGAFSAYQTQTADLIAKKVATSDFSAYQATTAKAIENKVESKDFNTYKTQTADAISSKVESNDFQTLQTQVNNSAVGTNLLTNTSDLSANWLLTGIVDTSQKPAVLHYPKTTLTSSVTNIASQQLNDGLFQPSTTYTASFHAKGAGTLIFYCYPSVANGRGDNRTSIKLTSDYKLYTITFTTTPDISGGKNFLLRQDYSPENTDQNIVEAYIYGLKLEKGSLATDWSLNPEDLATHSQITQLSGEIDQKVDSGDFSTYKTQTAGLIAEKVANSDFTTYQKQTADLISAKVETKDFSSYKDETAKSIDSMVKSKDFESYKTQTAGMIDSKVSNSNYTSDMKQMAGQIEDKVSNGTFTSYKTETDKDIAEKVANSDFTTYKTQTADLISSKVETKDFSSYKDETAEAISNKVESNDFNTYKTQTADAILSKVSKKDANNVNLIPYSAMPKADNLQWVEDRAGGTLSVTTHDFYHNGADTLYQLNTAGSNEVFAISPRFKINANTTYTFQLKGFASVNVSSVDVYVLGRPNGSTSDYTVVQEIIIGTVLSASGLDYRTVTFTTGAIDEAYLRIDNNGSNNGASAGLYFTELKMEPGDTATPYVYSAEDTMIAQTANDILLRVTKDDLLSQINMQAGNTLISASHQLTLSSKSVFLDSDNPVIMKSANIDKLLVGKKLTAADISANTFTTNNGTFTVKQDGSITAKNMTLNGGTLYSPTINASTINGSTINGTTFNAGSISTNANNTARFYPFTAGSDGVLRSYNVGDYFANYARMYSGNIVISDRNMTANSGSNKYGGETAVIGGSSISLSSGYTVGKDTDFTKPLVAEGEPGTTRLVLSGITGITLKGDDQKIHFHGMYSDKQPKGITFTPYGNINGDEGSTTGNWYVGYNLANMTAQFGIDNLSKNTIGLYRPTFVDEIGAMGNRLDNGKLLLHAVDGNAQMYLLNDGSPAVASPTIYNRTYSNGANIYVTSYGRIGRSTSASKYKLVIARSDDTLQADRLMTLKPASWNDKVATEKMAESLSNGEIPVEAEINLKRHYGLIAEDLRDAGLDEFLITGKDGQIEGIEYDRLWTVLIPKIKQLNNRINELERKTL